MEIFGICLSIPASFVLSFVYITLMAWVIRKLPRIAVPLNILSALVMVALGIEILFLLMLGAVRTYALLGPTYYSAHLVVFFFGVPSLANVLVTTFLRVRRPLHVGTGFLLALPCTGFALFLVLLQYGVSEAIFGID